MSDQLDTETTSTDEPTKVQKAVQYATTGASIYIGWKCGTSLYRRFKNHREAKAERLAEKAADIVATPA